MRLGDLDALKEDFKARLEKAKRWKENAINNGDDEIVIRATATIDFIYEVIMTINNAPTVELTEEQAIDKLHETGWLIRHDKEMTERPQGEFTDLERKVIADSINYLLGAELLEENGYTEEVVNTLKSVLQKIGTEENHI